MKLDKSDLIRWANCLITSPATLEELNEWVNGPLRMFFPFERVAIIYGAVSAGQIQMEYFTSIGHTETYLRQLAKTFDISTRESIRLWLTEREPILIDPENKHCVASEFERQEIQEFGLKNIAAHGILSLKANNGTYVSFAGVPGPLDDWHRDALNLIAPVLNGHLLKLLAKNTPITMERATESLTEQERRVTRAVLSGASDKQVAEQLGISAKTVRNHLSNIYSKLGVTKRSQMFDHLR